MDEDRLSGYEQKSRLWKAAEGLISSREETRDLALDDLVRVEGFLDSPLIAYLLITRLMEPDIEIRFRLVLLLGQLLDLQVEGPRFSDRAFNTVHAELKNFDIYQYRKLLEVSSKYLKSENAVFNILKLCSYASAELSGIVNDRKQPLEIRQQAVYFCGELGFLESRSTLENLIQRVEKARDSVQRIRSREDEEQLYPYALAAIRKMNT